MQGTPPRRPPGLDAWPAMGLLRRSTASLGSFAGIPFTYRLAIRRADTTVVVAIDPDARGSELMARLRAAGVAQLLLDRTLCRARVAGWDTALGAVIFDLPHLVEQAAPAA